MTASGVYRIPLGIGLQLAVCEGILMRSAVTHRQERSGYNRLHGGIGADRGNRS
jgi:hypothetical protein